MNAKPVRRTSPRHLVAVFAVFLSIFVGYCCISPDQSEALAREVGLVARDVAFAAQALEVDAELDEKLSNLTTVLDDISKALNVGDASGVAVALELTQAILDRTDSEDMRLALIALASVLRRVEAYSQP